MGRSNDTDQTSSARDRWRRGVATLGCSPAEVVALAVLAAGAVAALGLLWLLATTTGSGELAGAPTPRETVEPAGTAPPVEVADVDVLVHVAGEVVEPGLYTLPGGARVAEAIEAAGGLTPDAALDALNLARPVNDGEQLFVASVDEVAESADDAPAGSRAPGGTVNLNRASQAELEELPGVGPVTAERIVTHREANGPFTTVEELLDVPGIGEQTLASLSDLLSL